MNQAVATTILQAGHSAFLTGPAGSGKTFVLNEFITWAKAQGKRISVTASTGIAATHIGGTTIHSWSGIGIADQLSPFQLDALTQKKYLHSRFNSIDILILDEISMIDAARLDMVDTVLRAMRRNDEPFGGIQVILCGDFFQLPPIGKPGQVVPLAYESAVWRRMADKLAICYLDEVYRQSDDPLLTILQEIRAGEVTEGTIEELKDRMEQELPDHVTATKLFTHNVDVDELNRQELLALPADMQVFEMTGHGERKHITTLQKYCMAPPRLELKVGAAVMFVKNNFAAGYVNGTLGTVIDFEYDTVVVDTAEGKRITVRPETWAMEVGNSRQAEISQLPLRLAWAITIHKSQGMTLDDIEVDLSKSFAPGMGYVALSRVRSLSGLYLKGINQNALLVDHRVQVKDREFIQASEQQVEKYGQS